MAKTKEYSVDLRKRIVDSHQGGEGYDKISKKLNIAKYSVRGIIKRSLQQRKMFTIRRGAEEKRILPERAERKMVRYSKNNARVTTKESLEAMGPEMDVSRRTVDLSNDTASMWSWDSSFRRTK